MGGTISGGKAAAETNKRKYGRNFYKRIGRKGGQTETTKPKGFAAHPELAKQMGLARKGWRKSDKTAV